MAAKITTIDKLIKSTPGDFTVSCSGLQESDGSFHMYSIELKYDSASGYSLGSQTFEGSYGGCTFKGLQNLTRGRAVFAVLTDEITNKVVDSARVAIVNRLPTVTSFGQNTIQIQTGQSVTFNISGSDPDGQVSKITWAAGGQSGKISGSSASVTLNANNFDSGVYSIQFNLVDNLGEYSSQTGYFEVNHKLQITNLTVNYITKRNHNNTKDLATAVNVTYELSKSAKIGDYEIFAVCNSKKITLLKGNKGGAILAEETLRANIVNSNIPKGQQFHIGFTISNDLGSITVIKDTIKGQMYEPIGPFTNISYMNDGNGYGLGFFYKKITVNFTNPKLTENNFAIKDIKIQTDKGSYGDIKSISTQSGASNTIVIQENSGTTFVVTDSAGNQTHSLFGISLQKVKSLDTNANLNVTPSSFSYYNDEVDLTISHREYIEDYQGIHANYSYSLIVDNKTLILDDTILKENSSSNDNVKLKSNITISKILDKILDPKAASFNPRKDYDVKIILTVTDSFGQTASTSFTLKAIYNSPLQLIDKKGKMQFYHVFNTDFKMDDLTDDQLEKLEKLEKLEDLKYCNVSTEEANIFHRDETIIIRFPNIRKDNDVNVLTGIVLEINKQEIQISSKNPSIRIITKDDYFICYYARKIPTYNKNTIETYSFKTISASGQKSETFPSNFSGPDPYCSCYPIVKPSFDTTQVVTVTENVDNTKTITINTTFLEQSINDLISDTNSHFIRYVGIYDDEKKPIPIGGDIVAKVEISENENFSLPESEESDIGNLLEQKENRYSFNGSNSTSFTINVPKDSFNRFYMKFTITFTVGYNDTIVSIPVIKYYYGNTPTVAHRFHRVGLNTNEFQSDDILVIRDYDTYKSIRLIGKSGTQDKVVTINVQDGTIDGLTIKCGTW